jgi:NAD+ kinase
VARVAMIVHRERAQAADLAREAIKWLTERGHEVRVSAEDAGPAGLDEWSCPDDKLADDLDVAISLGGDGTMLRAVDLVSPAGVPVIGVNVGHLGYLTECEPNGLRNALERYFSGEHGIEERMTLEVTAQSPAAGGAMATVSALNEALLEKTEPGHTIRLAVTIGERPFITYAADGLILATPTGSTAYNLSVRGPIVSPNLAALVMTPVSPHQLFDRSLVLDPSEGVRVEVLDGPAATLLVDGRTIAELAPGDAVACRAGAHNARLVTFGPRDFHHILKSKFGLADR